MDEIEKWITKPETIAKSRKGYAHFDPRTNISKCQSYITNPKNIESHSFYPFIHYEQRLIKYHSKEGKKAKTRDICYASHLDRCVFQLYSHILNELYNKEIAKRGIDSVPVAYRTDLKLNNIDISKIAFDYIKQHSPSYVIIGDFSGFFDNLNHEYLKTRWCNLLGAKCLPKDHYSVFKNITRYSKWELSDICRINELEYNRSGRKELNSKKVVLTKQQFKRYRSHIIKNTNPYGIPQGSPISAILANLYMIDVDTIVYNAVTKLGGLYMRYSDDSIIVLPKNNPYFSPGVIATLNHIFNDTPGITLEPHKTQYYQYENGEIQNCSIDFKGTVDSKTTIDFLGFSFDGKQVTIRPKTISKYYYRMYSKAKTIRMNRGYTSEGKKISKKNIYQRYSIRGAYNKKGNFLTYVERAKCSYGKDEAIDKSTKNHMQKIKNALNGN